jgi:hypothetical protein
MGNLIGPDLAGQNLIINLFIYLLKKLIIQHYFNLKKYNKP